MKPRSKKEGLWRNEGTELRYYILKGNKAAKALRNFFRKQCNKAMRTQGKKEVQRGVDNADQ